MKATVKFCDGTEKACVIVRETRTTKVVRFEDGSGMRFTRSKNTRYCSGGPFGPVLVFATTQVEAKP